MLGREWGWREEMSEPGGSLLHRERGDGGESHCPFLVLPQLFSCQDSSVSPQEYQKQSPLSMAKEETLLWCPSVPSLCKTFTLWD